MAFGNDQVDHYTINRFRRKRLNGVLKQIFSQIVLLLADEGGINMKSIYTDGTKLEANANKYTFVWGKSIKTSKERIKKQLQELWDYAQSLSEEESKDTQALEFKEIDAAKVQQVIEQIDEALQDKPVKKKTAKTKLRQEELALKAQRV